MRRLAIAACVTMMLSGVLVAQGKIPTWGGEAAQAVKKQALAHPDDFTLWFYYAGPKEKAPAHSLVITNHSTHAARPMWEPANAIRVEVTPEQATKIVEKLDKLRLFDMLMDPGDRTSKYPSLYIELGGLSSNLGWGPQGVFWVEAVVPLLGADEQKEVAPFLAELKEATKPLAEVRKEKLLAGIKSFSFTVQYVGPRTDAANPFWSVTLSTAAIDQLAKPQAEADVIITEDQAKKLIDFLMSDGFFWRAVEDIPKDLGVPDYYIQVAAGGMRLEEDMGWGAPCVKRLGAIRAALDGPAAAAVDKAIARLDTTVKFEEEKEDLRQAVIAALLKVRVSADLGEFQVWFSYSGPAPAKPVYSLTLSTHAMEYSAHPVNALDAVISKDEAKKVLDWLEKSRFFTEAEPEILSRSKSQCYVMSMKGGGMQLSEPIGWAGPLFAKLAELKALVNADAAKQIDKLLAPLTEIAKEKADAGVAAARENIGKLELSVIPYYRHGANYPPHVRIVQGIFNAGEVSWTGVMDAKQAAKVVDVLEKSGFFSRATRNAEPDGEHCWTLYLGSRETGGFNAELGWGDEALKTFEALRGALEGDAAAKMTKFIAEAKAEMENPKPGPVLVSEAKMKQLNDERADLLKKNIDQFSLSLHYWGQGQKPFYSTNLHVDRQGYWDKNDKFTLDRRIDRQDAVAIVDCLHSLGVLGHAEQRDPQAEMRFTREAPQGPCYELSLNGGIWLVSDLGWGRPMLDKLIALRKVLPDDPQDNSPASDMDKLLERLSPWIMQWTGNAYAPPPKD